jgi:predicted Zn finger-like uncharacterized protein
MLFTRCPDCDTTFRVTDDALKKANGQVRCGRCASVFNAYAERRDGPAEPAAPPPSDDTPAPADEPSAAGHTMTPADASEPPAPAKSAPLPSVKIAHAMLHPPRRDGPRHEPASDGSTAPPPADDDALGSMSVADVVAQVEIGVADENADTGELKVLLEPNEASDGISPSQVQRVLEGADDASVRTWHLLDVREPRQRRRAWAVGSALALVALAAQTIHHYRAQLAANTAVGPLVAGTYAMLGSPVVPRWDIHQYEILDWIATAEPNTPGKGSLRITARIKNRGPLYQPYPSVHLSLKDRWEEAVGSRVFAPTEYLAAEPRKLMAPGETTRAEIEIVDPGQDAYGFELDVCIEVETHVLSCGSDKVFL